MLKSQPDFFFISRNRFFDVRNSIFLYQEIIFDTKKKFISKIHLNNRFLCQDFIFLYQEFECLISRNNF